MVVDGAEVELDRKITSNALRHTRINLAKNKYFKIASEKIINGPTHSNDKCLKL